MCEICGKEKAKGSNLCIAHEQELEYYAAQEFSLPYVPDFLRAEWIKVKRKELLG
jgi:hypothetical protein